MLRIKYLVGSSKPLCRIWLPCYMHIEVEKQPLLRRSAGSRWCSFVALFNREACHVSNQAQQLHCNSSSTYYTQSTVPILSSYSTFGVQ